MFNVAVGPVVNQNNTSAASCTAPQPPAGRCSRLRKVLSLKASVERRGAFSLFSPVVDSFRKFPGSQAGWFRGGNRVHPAGARDVVCRHIDGRPRGFPARASPGRKGATKGRPTRPLGALVRPGETVAIVGPTGASKP